MNFSIRRVRPSDGSGLQEFYAGLSPESRRARFLGFSRSLGDDRVRQFCTPDHVHDEGFVAVADVSGHQRIVGHLCLADAGERCLELGVAVADDLQGRGIGRRLFEAGLTWAHSHDVEQLVASAFADNTRVLRLLSSAPHGARIVQGGSGVVDVTIPLRGPLPLPIVAYPAAAARGRRRRPATGRRPLRQPRHVWWVPRRAPETPSP